ncbi:MAG: hypothetical protein JRJ57_02165 [Deltaproteobacteria bacterium]|nr:hypothetical protein [Deltaproteobacteria bacterium]MBW2105245.1 hypothetical protein [Deltaproteobacteria bacterium]
MTEKLYTLKELRALWIKYENTAIRRVLKQGRWHYEPVDGKPVGRIDGVRAEVKPLRTLMSFVKFLEMRENA